MLRSNVVELDNEAYYVGEPDVVELDKEDNCEGHNIVLEKNMEKDNCERGVTTMQNDNCEIGVVMQNTMVREGPLY